MIDGNRRISVLISSARLDGGGSVATAFELIYTWSETLQDWLSDAIRRLVSNGEITEIDRLEILNMLKEANGLQVEKTITPKPLSVTDFSSPSGARPKVVLLSMGDLKYVNAIAEKQTVTFSEGGITLIYGGNAAGKSGYSRVLKSACRARARNEKLHPNVFVEGSEGDIPEATFQVKVGDAEKPLNWVYETDCAHELSQLAVFDATSVRVYLDEANAVIYLPYGLDIFPKLAGLCSSLKTTLQEEIAGQDTKLTFAANLDPVTEAGIFIASINHQTDINDVRMFATLSPEELQRLTVLEKQLREIEAIDPIKKATELKRQKTRIDALDSNLTHIAGALSEESISKLRNQASEMKSKRELADESSKALFGIEPLAGAGSSLWKQMFEAARKYSQEMAYPSEDFPFVGEASRCVLCQQELGGDAKQRLERFEKFVQEDLEKSALLSAQLFKESYDEKIGIGETIRNIDKTTLEEIKELDSGLHIKIEAFLSAARSSHAYLAEPANSVSLEDCPKMPPPPSDELRALGANLETRAKEYEDLATKVNKETLEKEVKGLRDKKLIADNLRAVEKHITVLKKIHSMEECIAQTATGPITRKGSELSTTIITDDLRAALEKEISGLGLGAISIGLKKTAEAGMPRHQIVLGDAKVKVDPSEILSEGEQRVVAIASFLAELAVNTDDCGIIFDDPVCSLDHVYRERVAERLVAEASRRQVILFTHDIVFFHQIQSCAEINGVPLELQVIRRGIKDTGICSPDLPWITQKLRQRIGYLKNLLQQAKASGDKQDIDQYGLQVGQFYSLLREAWERAVEELLLNGCIERFRPSVETLRLSDVTVEEEDYKSIYKAMTVSSTRMNGHDSASAINPPIPDIAQLTDDLKEIEEFEQRVRQRNKETKKKRTA